MNDLDKGTGPLADNDGPWLAWSLGGLLFGGVVAMIFMATPSRPPAPPPLIVAPIKTAPPSDIAPAK